MQVAAAVCYVIALLAESAGIVLVWLEAQGAQRALRKYLKLNPEGNPGGSYGQLAELQPVIVEVLGSRSKRWLAVGLLIVGVVAGALGNFLTL